MRQFITIFLFIFCVATHIFAQKDSSYPKISTNKFIRLNYENDYFTQTDDYYTQGIKLESVNPVFRYSPIMWILPGLNNATVQYGLSLVQDCFTPTSITSNTILYGDRPFAGYIYLGQYKTSADYYKKQLLTAELDIGAIGSCAECAEEQKAIHSTVPGNTQPSGWQYQIGTGALVNYKLRYEKALYADTSVDIIGVGQAMVGTVYDNAQAGITLRFGKMQSYFLANHNKVFQLYAVVQAWVEGVAYNATMQGDLFTHNSIYTLSYKQMEPVVFGDSYGICLSYKNTVVTYSVTHITNEMINGNYHGWGHIDVTVYF